MDEERFSEYLKEVYFNNIYDLYDESCTIHKKDENGVGLCDRPMFSFMMATYNDDRLLNSAINSLLKQSYEDWELIILDNSDSNPIIWEMLQRLESCDKRIKCIKSEKNIGWPKAAETCLEQVRGKYTSFLAADDCLNIGILQYMSEVLCAEEPDILWVGNGCVECNSRDDVKLLSASIPDNKIWLEANRSDAIVEIMNKIYYNSFFHYLKVDFLKENNINFFEPYYADCGGMTQAIAVAKKMVSINQIAYFLTMNTSQTVGTYTWNSYEIIFARQWRSIREVFVRENYKNQENIICIATRILYNLIGNIECLCQLKCRDKYMNKLSIKEEEAVNQVEKIFLSEEIVEMIKMCEELFFGCLIEKVDTCKLVDRIPDSFVNPILILCDKSVNLSLDDKIQCFVSFLLEGKNSRCIGLNYLIKLIKSSERKIQEKYLGELKQIVSKYKVNI